MNRAVGCKLLIGIGLLAVALFVACRREAPQTASIDPDREVKLVVLEGPEGRALVMAPVYINGEGPFTFALDTGASHSVVDRTIAEKLNLSTVGDSVTMTGVASLSEAFPVEISSWRVGEIELPTRTLVMIDMPSQSRQFQLQGLLGSDMLSEFGVIRLDYDRGVLTLSHKQPVEE